MGVIMVLSEIFDVPSCDIFSASLPFKFQVFKIIVQQLN